jgi:hypothetical protein
MDVRLQEIFDSVSPEEPCSRLEPYKALILRLHDGGRTYRRIQQILSEKCGITVAYSTLYEFVQRRSRPRQPVEAELAASEPVEGQRLQHHCRVSRERKKGE